MAVISYAFFCFWFQFCLFLFFLIYWDLFHGQNIVYLGDYSAYTWKKYLLWRCCVQCSLSFGQVFKIYLLESSVLLLTLFFLHILQITENGVLSFPIMILDLLLLPPCFCLLFFSSFWFLFLFSFCINWTCFSIPFISYLGFLAISLFYYF